MDFKNGYESGESGRFAGMERQFVPMSWSYRNERSASVSHQTCTKLL